MAAEQTWRLIDEQRADLADMLDTLTGQQWSARSLCPDWTVRDVVAHLTQANESWARLGVAAVRSGFRFNAMVSRLAREDTRTPEELTTALRAMVGVRRRPPGTAVADPLADTLVHGQDIAIPLGIKRTMPIPAAVIAAEHLWGMKFPMNPQKRFAGVAFEATDAPFAVGAGRPVRAPIQDILLALYGRSAAAGLPGQSAAASG